MLWQVDVCWGFWKDAVFQGRHSHGGISVKLLLIPLGRGRRVLTVLMFNILWKRWVNHPSKLPQRLFCCRALLSVWSNSAAALHHAHSSISNPTEGPVISWQKASVLGQIKNNLPKVCPWLVLIELEGNFCKVYDYVSVPFYTTIMAIFTGVSYAALCQKYISVHVSLPHSHFPCPCETMATQTFFVHTKQLI